MNLIHRKIRKRLPGIFQNTPALTAGMNMR
jgi:hypothetical protein